MRPREMPPGKDTHCSRLTVSPQKSYVDNLTPSTSKCDLIWSWGLYRGNQVKIRPLGPHRYGSVGWASSIPGLGTCLGCGFGSLVRACMRGNQSMFLSLPSPPSKNK